VRLLRVAVLLFLSAVLAACGCTTIGCGPGLQFDYENLTQWAGAESFAIEVCVDGVCDTRAVMPSSAVRSIEFTVPEESPTVILVEITATTDAQAVHATGRVTTTSSRPNGPFCSPLCRSAEVIVDGEELRNR
jgi:hypothetical protein